MKKQIPIIHHRPFAQGLKLWWCIFAIALNVSGLLHGQLTLTRNGEFSNLVDSNGNIVYTVVQNGQFSNVIDQNGNLAYTLSQNGGFLNLVDLDGNVVATATQNGEFLNFIPDTPKMPRRSEIAKSARLRAEIKAYDDQQSLQNILKQQMALAESDLKTYRKSRSHYTSMGFTSGELDRFERVLVKLKEAFEALMKKPKPVQRLTGIGESNSDFDRRNASWRRGAEPHLKMIELCHAEITKFSEKRSRLMDK
jgi:hypothetical protein